MIPVYYPNALETSTDRTRIVKGVHKLASTKRLYERIRDGEVAPPLEQEQDAGAIPVSREAQAQAKQPGEGLATLVKALALVEETGEHHWEAELYRLQAELLLVQGDHTRAKVSLDKAI